MPDLVCYFLGVEDYAAAVADLGVIGLLVSAYVYEGTVPDICFTRI